MPVCPQCGEENPDRARFCLACATALEEEAAPQREIRKTVTVLFAEDKGVTVMAEKARDLLRVLRAA